jgi:hypothetical protein
MPVLWSRARPVTVTVMTYFCLCIDTACKYSISVPVYPYDQRLNQPDSEAAASLSVPAVRDSDLLSLTLLQRASAAVVSSFKFAL